MLLGWSLLTVFIHYSGIAVEALKDSKGNKGIEWWLPKRGMINMFSQEEVFLLLVMSQDCCSLI